MGLDYVEVLMEIEDEFGISLDFEELDLTVTAGDLCQSVIRAQCFQDSLARAEGLTACPNVSAFLNLRTSISSVTGHSKSLIRTETQVETLLPSEERQSLWWDISRQSKIVLPGLILSKRAAIVHRTVWFVTFIAVIALLWPLLSTGTLIVGPFVLLLCSCLIEPVFESHRIQIPTSCRTISGMLSQAKRTYVPRKLGKNEPTFDEIWIRIQKILSEQLDIPLDKISPESRLIQDLRMD